MNKIDFVNNDMQRSMLYVEKARPIIQKLLPGWTLSVVEGISDNKICTLLDLDCGIDYLLHRESFVFGLASRVQYGKNWRTFTIRKMRESATKTEYEKRKSAIAVEGIIPKYDMQLYVDSNNEEILGLAIAKTKDLIEFIECGYAEEKATGMDKIGQAKFYICSWDKLKELGYTVLEYNADD